MNETPPSREYVLARAMDLITVRSLVECMLVAMPDEQQVLALQLFADMMEGHISQALAYAQQDGTVHALQQAAQAQGERLGRLGLQVPPARSG